MAFSVISFLFCFSIMNVIYVLKKVLEIEKKRKMIKESESNYNIVFSLFLKIFGNIFLYDILLCCCFIIYSSMFCCWIFESFHFVML